jgi:hypothetical protein
MLRRAPILVRLLAVVFALLQASAPSLAAYAEGALASRGGTGQATTHIEDTRQASCPFVHEVECALCAYVSLLPRPETAPVAVAFEPRARELPDGAPAVAERQGEGLLPPARAPPRV